MMTTKSKQPIKPEESSPHVTLEDGSIRVNLIRGLTLDGTKVMSLTMREPTVADQLAMHASKGNDAEKELTFIANLCELAPVDLHTLTAKDFRRVQAAFLDFME